MQINDSEYENNTEINGESQSKKEQAISFVELNCKVLPLNPRDNSPACAGGIKSATDDAERVRKWWEENPNCNVGVPTGSGSGVVVLEISSQSGASEALARLCPEHGDWPQTFEVKVGDIARQYWFLHNGPLPSRDFANGCTGMSLIADGGFVPAPGSSHPSGAVYEPVPSREFIPLPGWLRELAEGGGLSEDRGEIQEERTAPLPASPAAESESDRSILGVMEELVVKGGMQLPTAIKLRDQFGEEAFVKEFGPWENAAAARAPLPARFAEAYARIRAAIRERSGAKNSLSTLESSAQQKTRSTSEPGNTRTSSTRSSQGAARPRKQISSDAEIEQYVVENWLSWIAPPKNRAESITVGMALHSWARGEDIGCQIWDEYSQWLPEYDAPDLKQEYARFRDREDRAETTVVSLYHIAREGLASRFNATMALRLDSPNSEIYQRLPKKVLVANPAKLKLEHENQPFYTLENGKVKRSNPYDVWVRHEGRRGVTGLIAHPSGEVFVEGAPDEWQMNVWRGFPKAGNPGKCSLFKGYLFEVIANGDEAVRDWLWKTFAWLAQNPTELPRVSLVLYGPNGTGKGTLCEYLAAAFGEYNSLLITSQAEVENEFNSLWQGCRLVALDEAVFMNHPKVLNEMKAAVTRPRMTINPKGVNQYVAPNFAFMVFMTNEAIPLKLEDDDRRWVLLRPSEKYATAMFDEGSAEFKEAVTYWNALYAEKNGDGPASLLAELLAERLDDFKPYPRLLTRENRDIMAQTDLGPDEWFREIVESGVWPLEIKVFEEDWDGRREHVFKRDSIIEYAQNYARKHGIRFNKNGPGRLLNKLEFPKRGRGDTTRIIPPLSEVRAKWRKQHRHSAEFQHRAGWEQEEWEFQHKVPFDKNQFLHGEVYAAFDTEKKGA